jgi:hypothetical protein
MDVHINILKNLKVFLGNKRIYVGQLVYYDFKNYFAKGYKNAILIAVIASLHASSHKG